MSMLVCSPCVVCEQEIADGDVAVRIGEGDRQGWAHAVCTAEGVRRWLREGRPGADPLAWERSERPRWRPDPADGRAWVHVHPDAGTLPPSERRIESA